MTKRVLEKLFDWFVIGCFIGTFALIVILFLGAG